MTAEEKVAYMQRWRRKNRAHRNAYLREWRRLNPSKKRALEKAYYYRHHARRCAYLAAWGKTLRGRELARERQFRVRIKHLPDDLKEMRRELFLARRWLNESEP